MEIHIRFVTKKRITSDLHNKFRSPNISTVQHYEQIIYVVINFIRS